MPQLRKGYRQLATQVPEAVLEGLQGAAERNGWSFADEVTFALRRHLMYPALLVPPPLPAEVPADILPARKASAPKKPRAKKKPK